MRSSPTNGPASPRPAISASPDRQASPIEPSTRFLEHSPATTPGLLLGSRAEGFAPSSRPNDRRAEWGDKWSKARRERDFSGSRHRHFVGQGAVDRRRTGLVAEASQDWRFRGRFRSGSEQNPEDWIEGVEAAVAAVRRHAPRAFAGLAGIGLSGQMHGATFLDAGNRVLRPAILWNDGRSFAQCVELERRVSDFRRAQATGDARFHRAQGALGRRA